MRAALPVAVVLLALAGRARADPPAAPVAPEAARHADVVLAAVAAKDVAALETLAAADDPDPWWVVDDLMGRGRADAAEAFAKAAARGGARRDAAGLPAYVAGRTAEPGEAALRAALSVALAALREGRAQDALAATGRAGPAPSGVLGIAWREARGMALRLSKRFAESETAFLAAADAAIGLGWWVEAGKAFDHAGNAASDRGDARAAGRAWDRRLAVEEARGDRVAIGRALVNSGSARFDLGDPAGALEHWERAGALAEETGDRTTVARALGNVGTVQYATGNPGKALETFRRAATLHEASGERAEAARMLANSAVALETLGRWTEAAEVYARVIALREELGDRAGVAKTLGNLAGLHLARGEFAKALEANRRALAVFQETGDRAAAGRALGNLGVILSSMGDAAGALANYREALAIAEELGDRLSAANLHGSLGLVEAARGDTAAAIDSHERSLRLHESMGDRGGVARTLGNLGLALYARGEFAKALDAQERALALKEEVGDRPGAAATLVNLGSAHVALGRPERAIDAYERAARVFEALGDRPRNAALLANLAAARQEAGDPVGAERDRARALAVLTALGDRAGIARLQLGAGNARITASDPAGALARFEEARALFRAIGDRGGETSALAYVAGARMCLGEMREGVADLTRALADAEEMGAQDVVVYARGGLAAAHLKLGSPREAMDEARRAIAATTRMVRGLDAEGEASARGRLSDVIEVGTQAAAAAQDVESAFHFLESGRSVALLESLGGRERMRAVTVPAALREAETAARAEESAAVAAHRSALASGVLPRLRASRARYEAAREAVAQVLARIERDAKAAADVLAAPPPALAAVRAGLGEDQEIVLYALGVEEAFALRVGRAGARLVRLGPTKDVAAACGAVLLDRPPYVAEEGVAALRRLVIEPLGLPATTRRLLVSPDGALSYVPFVLLDPAREIACVPSAGTHALLAQERDARGTGVLALGDPEYGAARKGPSDRARGGASLARLPATREEAEAVGDVVLLGARATASSLEATLATRARWRAVHLACHGLVDPERPLLSSLALTPEGDDDGLLTAVDVFQARIPADLVVLSACETGKGKVVRGEGIVGLARSFMFAGSPRVICSLWKVDDEATRALMTRFYALWNPRTGSKGLGTAAALRQAQASVRDLEVERVDAAASQAAGREVRTKVRPFTHPQHWAGWVLWGLAD